jgi:hypothetical protein
MLAAAAEFMKATKARPRMLIGRIFFMGMVLGLQRVVSVSATAAAWACLPLKDDIKENRTFGQQLFDLFIWMNVPA